MSELPGYEPTAPDAPKKSRKKPMKRRQVKKVAAEKPVAKKRRKRRARIARPVEQHAGGKFTPEFYRVVGLLMGLDIPIRNLAMEVVKGLTK